MMISSNISAVWKMRIQLHVDNTTQYALADARSSSEFKWDDDLCEFYETLKYLGGQRMRNFVRGPGFLGTGRGGVKEFKSFSDFNLGGPSSNTSKRCQAGYTTQSGIIKENLNSFRSLSELPSANVGKLLDTEIVQVIPVSLAADGTALKPGLEFDTKRKCIVRMVNDVSPEYVKANPIPNAEEIKKLLVTGADVMCITAMDNGGSMPVGVHYLPKSVTGNQTFSTLEEAVKTIQVCKNCICRQNAVQHMIDWKGSGCDGFCNMCWETKDVCPDCAEQGQTSYVPSLRACKGV